LDAEGSGSAKAEILSDVLDTSAPLGLLDEGEAAQVCGAAAVLGLDQRVVGEIQFRRELGRNPGTPELQVDVRRGVPLWIRRGTDAAVFATSLGAGLHPPTQARVEH
jgi:hypothetical protein